MYTRILSITLLVVLLQSQSVFAHSDFWKFDTSGNVITRIKTGFHYEEINKVSMIGKMAFQLCKRIGYTDSVLLDFEHYYVEDCAPDYFASFDNGGIREIDFDYGTPAVFGSRKLIIRTVAKQFDAAATLRLLEYAANNLALIKATQQKQQYHKNYCNWTLFSISTHLTRQLAQGPSSPIVREVLAGKIYRPQTVAGNTLSYFFKDNAFNIYYKNQPGRECVLLSTRNIFQWCTLSVNEALVFTSPTSFYYVAGNVFTKITGPLLLKNGEENYKPLEVMNKGAGNVTISFEYYERETGSYTNPTYSYSF